MTHKTIAVASDHRGLLLKSLFALRLEELGYKAIDFGTNDENSCDAGDFAQRVAADMREHPEHRGILICGSGQAMAMTANILVLGAHIVGQEVALDCLDMFLTTKFLEGRFTARRDKLTAIGGI